MFDLITQIIINVFGALVLYLIGSKKGVSRKKGYFLGMFVQPFWFANASSMDFIRNNHSIYTWIYKRIYKS